MPSLAPFTPGATVILSGTTSSSRVALGAGGGDQIRVASLAANAVTFVKFDSSTVTAAVTDYPIMPGTVEVLTIPSGATHVAGITGTGTSTVYFTRGDGQ